MLPAFLLPFLGKLVLNNPIANFIKNNLITIILVGLLGVFGFFAYNYIENKFQELDKAKIELAQQKGQLESLSGELGKLKESNSATQAQIAQMHRTQEEFDTRLNQRIKTTNEKIRIIETDPNLSKKEKQDKKSEVYIDELNALYCEFEKGC